MAVKSVNTVYRCTLNRHITVHGYGGTGSLTGNVTLLSGGYLDVKVDL